MAPKLQVSDIWLPCLILLVFWARPTAAFGAGNIASLSAIEGQNWRHGDIEDTLLTLLISSRTGKKFSKMDVKRVYFGNWLRDYSQAVDVGTVKAVSAEAIRLLLWVLGFLSFGYGTKEFEVTRDRLGCYRPEEHIDNPKDYADNLDARDYDRRLRGPVDEERELSINERTGLKNYIASEDTGIMTSAGMVRDLLRRCIDLGQRSGGRGPDFYEALRLLGTATHCMEDYSAHSNYTELALIELGATDVFPHVGRDTRLHVEEAGKEVYPIVTGTFGGVDFLHSVCGEITDKTTQSELQELEGAITDADRKQNKSQIKELLAKLPDGIFGGKDEAGKADELESNASAAAMNNLHVTPLEPEAFTQQAGELVKQIYPIMEFHDEIMQAITEFIEKIPVIPDLIEEVQSQITIFVFSLLAPYVLPILNQVKAELETGSSEVIASSREKQYIVFNDDRSSDPTHSMLSKDHFSNILNEPAGQVASAVLKWAVPQVVKCWDGEADSERTIDLIINAVFHHPACVRTQDREVSQGRQIMFDTVRQWWESHDRQQQRSLTQKLSREGVQNGENHRGDVSDKGHGCCKPLGMANDFSGVSGGKSNQQAQQVGNQAGKFASEAVGGGALGGLVGGLVGGVGASLLSDAFNDNETNTQKNEYQGNDGSYTQSYTESGHHRGSSRGDSDRYGEAQYKQTQLPSGGRREEYSRHEQDDRGESYSYQQRVETSGYPGSGGYERREERHVQSGGEWKTSERREGFDQSGQFYAEEDERRGKSKSKSKKHSEDDDSEDDDEKRAKKERKRREKEEKEEKKKHKKKHGSGDDDSDDDADKRHSGSGEHRRRSQDRDQEHRRKKSKSPERRSGGYSQGSGGYGEEKRYGEEGRGGSGYGREESSGYGRQEYGGRQETSGYGREEQSGYGGGREERSGYGGGREERSGYGGGREERSGYGGGRDEDEYGQESHGRGHGRRRDEDEDESSRGMPGGFGGDDGGYGRRY
ncbi:Het-C-domain-containing protein [Dothidotthia symphoricarpi CBS 119687]|uniref:Het-C-domain-containing protein n=1 Tax=Dothidotthia symphoricarpi CBS 119687 TaxID=1392245 RepID=A0A6A6AA39_9PLEO|nr:Het-C-domain-containing protein [Dothidotthia symphoricarpi CBS 119687]KAF2127954.1 Het-C-domain-containing protein [Dothidotthia symphoricarpi CBS 119687]